MNDDNNVLVSIIMPVYNSEKYIDEAIQSILEQTYSNWELIIINEFGSNLECSKIIKKYSLLDKRITIKNNIEKLGISESINVGMKNSNGKYIARMDADDISLPRRIEEQVKYLNENPEIMLCGCKVEVFGEEKFDWVLETNFNQIKTNILFYSPCVHPTIMFRREIIEKGNIFYNKNYKATEDFDFFSRVLDYGEISNVNKILFKYRLYGDNATFKNNSIGYVIYNEIMDRQFKKLDLDFTEKELKLLSVHYSMKGAKYEEVLKRLIDLDLLLKKILVSNNKVKKYKNEYLFKTLHKRFKEAYDSISWACKEYDKNKARKIYDYSIFSREEFYTQELYANAAPEISVLLPTYNSENYIADTVWSVLTQSFSNFELLILNEFGSNDDTINIVKLFNDDRVVIIQNENKLGLADSLNKGIKIAKGKYIARIDADDLADIDRFKIQYEFLEKNEEYSLCGTWQEHFGINTDHIHKVPLSNDDIKANLIYNCEICHSTVMFRKKDFVDNNLFYDSSKYAEDYELWTRAINKLKFINLPQILGKYRVGSDNITQKKLELISNESSELAYKNITKNLKVNVPKEHIFYMSGWINNFNNIKSKDDYVKHMEIEKNILTDMFNNNKIYKTYNQDSLLQVINRRWKTVTNKWIYGTNLDKVEKIEDVFKENDDVLDNYNTSKQIRKQKGIKKYLKNFLMFFYRPFKYKIVDKIRQQLWDLDGNLKDSTRDIRQTVWDCEGHIKDEIYILNESINYLKNQMTSISYFNEQLLQIVDSLSQQIESRAQKTEKNLSQEFDSRVWKAEENLGQQLDSRVWKAEENLGQKLDSRVWKAEEKLSQKIDDRVLKSEENFENIHRHIDFTYRDIMILLKNNISKLNKTITLETKYPIAYESNDHLFPHGTIRDNTRYPRFIRSCEQFFDKIGKGDISFLDLGCSGGGIVLDALLRGHVGIGLEGSDESLKQQRAEWRLLENNLFTCDITKEFSLMEFNHVKKFDVISAWEVLEHIKEEDLSTLISNINKHLNDDGIFIASIANWDDIDPATGVNWHVTKHAYDWWGKVFKEQGFKIMTNEFSPLDLARGTVNPPNVYEKPYKEYDLNKTFYIVVSK